jgi:hypothetical protein
MDENKKQFNDKDIKVLRTYTSDMADAIKTNETSVIKIALAEKEKKEREEVFEKAEGTTLSKILLIVGGIILISGAIIGSYILIQKKKVSETIIPIVKNIETLISYDSQVHIDATNAINITDLSGLIKNNINPNPGLINSLFLEKNISGSKELLTSKDFLKLIDATAPGALIRSLSDQYLLGEYYKSPKTTPSTFLIFQTTNYNQTYASMLTWEKTMLKDLFVILNINIISPENGPSTLFEKNWDDIIINNIDARVLHGENNEAILYYAFVNKNNLVITQNILSMKEIMARLITQNIQPK